MRVRGVRATLQRESIRRFCFGVARQTKIDPCELEGDLGVVRVALDNRFERSRGRSEVARFFGASRVRNGA
jgi:hypothetical protein